jgi:hypothetical protein
MPATHKPVTRIDYATWRTEFGAELRAGASTDHVEVSKICARLSTDGEAILTADAADALAVALVEAAALARGTSLDDATNVVANLGSFVRQRRQTRQGGPAADADPAAVKSLDEAIKEEAAARAAKLAAGKTKTAGDTVETELPTAFVPGPRE